MFISSNRPVLITDQSEFEAINIVPVSLPTPQTSIVHEGLTYSVVSEKIQTYHPLTLLFRRVLAISVVVFSLTSALWFTSSSEWVSNFWQDRKIYRLVKPVFLGNLDPSLAFLPALEERNTKKLMGLGVYPICNETNLDSVYEDLKSIIRSEGDRVHIGCAGWHNFDIIVSRQSSCGIVFDINVDSANFMKKSIELLRTKTSKEEFEKEILEYMQKRQEADPKTFFCKHDFDAGSQIPLLHLIEHERGRVNSWLNSEENYQYIRGLAISGKLAVIQQDIKNTAVFREIKQKLLETNWVIDTVYISNIANFMEPKSDPIGSLAFTTSVTSLLEKDTILISSPLLVTQDNKPRNDKYGKSRIHQITLMGADIKQEPNRLFFNAM